MSNHVDLAQRLADVGPSSTSIVLYLMTNDEAWRHLHRPWTATGNRFVPDGGRECVAIKIEGLRQEPFFVHLCTLGGRLLQPLVDDCVEHLRAVNQTYAANDVRGYDLLHQRLAAMRTASCGGTRICVDMRPAGVDCRTLVTEWGAVACHPDDEAYRAYHRLPFAERRAMEKAASEAEWIRRRDRAAMHRCVPV